jgi:hypothetical protein
LESAQEFDNVYDLYDFTQSCGYGDQFVEFPMYANMENALDVPESDIENDDDRMSDSR